MKHLLSLSLNTSNSTTNLTCMAGKPWNPACGALQPIGQRNVCVNYDEYVAAATLNENSEQYTDGTFFCKGYTDYAAACDLHDNLTCNNAFAAKMYENFKRALSVYSCKSYSRIWTCDDCASAYKRWLCSQVYKKFYIPDSGYYEEGVVLQASKPCVCGEQETDEECKRYCNGMPNDCYINSEHKWECTSNACGSGNCTGQLMLGSNASTTSGFYVNAKVEIIDSSVSGSGAEGQWAVIQQYYGFAHATKESGGLVVNGVAMFDQWRLPAYTEGKIKMPQPNDVYRIYWEDAQRGYCRLSARPLVRKGQPCETGRQYKPMEPLYDPDESINDPAQKRYNLGNMTAFKAYSYCGEDSKCVQVDPKLSPSGYLCCNNSGMYTVSSGIGQNFVISYLNITGPDGPRCWAANGNNYTQAIEAISGADQTQRSPMAAPEAALGAVEASGCTDNFTTIPEKVVDDCVLRTCSPVCFDVSRRCPPELEFACPDLSDNREYDNVICNMAVNHGNFVLIIARS